MPTLLMHGECTPQPLSLITRRLAEVMKPASWEILKGADHMAPVMRSFDVAAGIARHIARAGGPSSDEAPTAFLPSRHAG
jgi:hypothetical protein